MNKQETKEQLQKVVRDAQEKLYAVEVAERIKKNSVFVGKTFKYRNSYSCPEKPTDYWWMYAKVTECSEADGLLYATTFQTDKYGDMTVQTRQNCYHMQGYTPCKLSEFNNAWKRFRAKIESTL